MIRFLDLVKLLLLNQNFLRNLIFFGFKFVVILISTIQLIDIFFLNKNFFLRFFQILLKFLVVLFKVKILLSQFVYLLLVFNFICLLLKLVFFLVLIFINFELHHCQIQLWVFLNYFCVSFWKYINLSLKLINEIFLLNWFFP